MAIDIANEDHRSRLARAIRRGFTDSYYEREKRQNLIRIYADRDDLANFLNFSDEQSDLGTLLNLFQKYVKGHLLTLAHYSPRWSINARTKAGRGIDKRIEGFLNRYCEIIQFQVVQQQLALDSAFGWAVAYVDNGIPPKGIEAPVSPNLYRIDPDTLLLDRAAATFKECSFIGHTYLVSLEEAQSYEGFDPEAASKITEYTFNSGSDTYANSVSPETKEQYAEPMARLVDIYIPKRGTIYTWNCPNNDFNQITQEPLGSRTCSINPYCILSLMDVPGAIQEISRLASLRGLHLLANEMLDKGVQQARASQRNPVGPLGSEQDLSTALTAGDNNPIFLEHKENLGMFSIPGPDPSILNLGSQAAQMFSQEAGNLEVALGASTGADTARQTDALLGQISASQSIDRRHFEQFLAEIGAKIASLAYSNEALQLEYQEKVAGTNLTYTRIWAPALQNLPTIANIDSFNFDIAEFSTAFRTPQERLKQLQQASQLIMSWMQAAAQGAPISLEAIMGSVEQAFDLIPELKEWWSGKQPTPAEKTRETYTSLAESPAGSDVRYHSDSGGGGAPAPAEAGGLS